MSLEVTYCVVNLWQRVGLWRWASKMAEGSAARMDEISQSLPKRRELRVSNEKGRYGYVLASEMFEDQGSIWESCSV
jgi:hypothetical protein